MIPQGYKQTELGIIPEEWEIKKIFQLGEVVTGTTPSRNVVDYWNGSFHWISAIDFSSKYICKTHENLTNLGRKQCRVIPNGSVLVTCIASIGLNAIAATECATNQQINAVICNNNVYNEYLYYQICNQTRALLLLAGQTAVPIISKREFQELAIAIPSNIEEQKRIAEALSDVDALIVALDRKIAKKRLIKQGAMQQLLTGKKRSQGFTDEWEYITLGELLEYEQPTKYLVASAEYEKTGTPVLTAGKTFILGYTSEIIGIYNAIPVIIFDDFTTNSKYVTMPFKAKSSAMKMLQLRDPRYSLRLIFELMQIIQFPLYDHQRYWISEYSKLQIYIPTNFEEQQAIATILSDMDKEIADLETRRDKYKLIKSGMMQKLLTGQIRLVKPLAPIIPLAAPENKIREIPLQTHIVAGHVVNTLYQSSGWGRTKLQKTLHLVGYHCQLDFGNEYIRNTAGPDDQTMMNHIDSKFKQYRHVKIVAKKDNGKTRYNYIPTAMIDELEQVYETYPQRIRDAVDSLINKIKKMDLARAEIVSTLYAVWNNRIIKGEQISDDLLLADFYAWSKHKSDFSRDLVFRGLNYMRKENIIPVGWGKYIDKSNNIK